MRLHVLSLILGLAAVIPAAAQDPIQSAPSSQSLPVQKLDPLRERANQLDRFFAQLQKAETPEAAAAVEKKIWAQWNSNLSPTAEVLLHQSSVAMADGQWETAEDMLGTLISSYPDYTEAFNRRATLYYSMKRYDDSLADIARVLDKEPRHFGALSGMGMILREQGKYAAAKSAFQDALAVNPRMQSAEEALVELRRLAPDI